MAKDKTISEIFEALDTEWQIFQNNAEQIIKEAKKKLKEGKK